MWFLFIVRGTPDTTYNWAGFILSSEKLTLNCLQNSNPARGTERAGADRLSVFTVSFSCNSNCNIYHFISLDLVLPSNNRERLSWWCLSGNILINDNEITSQFLIGHYAEVFSTKLIVIRVKKDLIENVSLVTNFLS